MLYFLPECVVGKWMCTHALAGIFLPDRDPGKRREKGQRIPHCYLADHRMFLGISHSSCPPTLELLNGKCHLQNVFLQKAVCKLKAESQKDSERGRR